MGGRIVGKPVLDGGVGSAVGGKHILSIVNSRKSGHAVKTISGGSVIPVRGVEYLRHTVGGHNTRKKTHAQMAPRAQHQCWYRVL